ncbi:coiled-coil domain-containing protein [Mucilaginibacter xinganensis]|uniref:Hemagglutinin n=1 Tax=Mucilaginibacter xinganensis TaxID=1234841 RepID=A0A223NXX7_9SPHI|nr:hypothetical protein [Mucilaginibacter xinganensis]ASU34421.1 hemagglutinin [Mucilaginibacter xinganensis]
MPQLEYSISGDNSGLIAATDRAIGNIENLTNAINNANISLQFKNGIAALDTLGQKLLVAQGNATLFGDSIGNQTQQISAYQSAINSLLANGYDPMSADIQRLKGQIDDLNASIASTPKVNRSFVNDTSNTPSAENLSRPQLIGSVQGESAFVTALNQQLASGAINAQEYSQALAGANSTAQTLGQTTQQTAEQIAVADGYVIGLKQALADLNSQRLIAPAQDLVALNAEIQQVEISLQQAKNIGKVGFDEMGNAIKGVSLQNVNGQIIALSNNLFGARQIAKDVVRTLDSSNLAGVAKGIGLLAVDFLYYAQNAQFAAGATTVATGAIAAEGTVAASSGISTAALGAAFSSLLTPVNLIILGVALLGGGLLAYERHQKTAAQAATEHLKALREQKQALEDVLSTLNAQQRVEAKASEIYSDQIAKLNELYTALEQQVSAGNDYTSQLTDLQNAFPQFFANIDTAAAKTNALTEAYKNAGEAIKALGLVTAALQLSGESNKSQVQNQVAADALLAPLQKVKKELEDATKEFNKNGAQFSQSFSGPGQGGASVAASNLSVLKKQYDDLNDKIHTYNVAVATARAQTDAFNKIAVNNQSAADAGKNSGLINSLEKQLANLKAIEPYLKTQEQVNKNIAEQKKIQAELDSIEGKNAANLLKSKQEELSIQQQIADIIAKSGADANKSGLTGYALQVADITSKYEAFGVQLDKIATKIANQSALFSATNGKRGLSPTQAANDTSALNNARGILTVNESKQLSDAQIKEAQITADAITKINNDFGIKQQFGYNEELSHVKRLYDDIIVKATEGTQTLAQINANYQNAITKANGNQSALDAAKTNYDAQIQQANDAQAKILAAKSDLLPAIQAIDEKYIQQEQQVYDKIVDIANQAFITLDDGETSRTDKINSEWQKRISSANAYFNKLRELAVSSKLPQSAVDNINSVQSQVNGVLNTANFEAVSIEISKNFAAAMQSATQGFVTDFYTSLTGLGAARQSIDAKYSAQLANAQDQATRNQINRIKELEKQSTTSFGAIFSDLVNKFSTSFNQSILQSFTKQITENLGKTLLTPTASQLKISPEEQSAERVSTLLKSAGTSLADQIKQAGLDFYNTTKGGSVGGLLSGASGGSSIVPGLTANTGLGSFAPNSDGSLTFGNTVETSASNFKDAATKAGGAIGSGAETGGKAITEAGNHLSSKVASAAAALSLAGGLVSGATSPTSKVGQGVGGLLKGAGEGALIGSAFGPEGTVIGAIGGALIGGISGLFSASKAQKELQAQQLAEQQQQTALLKASLAYTSQIIGRDTANGIVTGISVGAFGQLVATVSGKDLQFILDRSSNGR